MNYWKAGCKWGEGGEKIYPIFEKYNIVFEGKWHGRWHNKEGKFPKNSDMIAIADGFWIFAIAKVKNSVRNLGEKFPDINEGGYENDYRLYGYEVELFKLEPKECIEYKNRASGSKIHKREIQKSIKRLWAKYKGEKEIQEKQNTMNNKMEEYCDLLEQKKQIILQGAPGTGKTYLSPDLAVSLIDWDYWEKNRNNRDKVMKRYNELVEAKQIMFTTFHQSVDYEEFVEGYKPDGKEGNLTYKVEDGIFKQICEKASLTQKKIKNFLKDREEVIYDYHDFKNHYKVVEIKDEEVIVRCEDKDYTVFYKRVIERWAKENWEYEPDIDEAVQRADIAVLDCCDIPNVPHILIIDEINRGNISKILGELITLLEADKRLGEDNEIKVTLPYSKKKFTVPPNLYVIGTMNTADRSIGTIDYAVRRRFAFISLKAEKEVIEKFYTDEELDENLKNKATGLFEKVKAIFDKKENIDPDLKGEDLMVGHSYFMAKDDGELNRKLEYEIKPLLLEYVKDNVLVGDALEKEINDLKLE